MRAVIGDVGRDLHAAVDRAGGEDQHVRLGPPQPVAVHAEQVGVLADRREERPALPLELHPQQVDAVAFGQDVIEAVRDFDAELA